MEQRGISKLDLKRQNRLQILRVIRENGPISRVDIAAKLRLTRAAVTIITNEMIAQGVLQELGEAPIEPDKLQKGRRKILIGINASYKFALGANVAEKYVSVGLTTLDAEVLDKAIMEIDDTTTALDVAEFVIRGCKDMVSNSCLGNGKIIGLGVGIVPAMWQMMGVRLDGENVVCKKLAATLSDALGMPVLCGNAIGLLALATQDFSSMHGRRLNQILIAAGDQYNVAVLNENELLRDYRTKTYCIERFIVKPGGARFDGYPDGSVKAEISFGVVLKRLHAAFSEDDTPCAYELTGGDPSKLNFEILNESFARGDQPFVEILQDVLNSLAILTNNLMCVHFADKTVLQNFVMNEYAFNYFRNRLAELGGVEMADRIEFSRADTRYSFLGGCALAIYQLFYERGGLD